MVASAIVGGNLSFSALSRKSDMELGEGSWLRESLATLLADLFSG
jgi:hypothetical protein